MPDKPKDPPTYEEIERELGPDLMSFMSEMLRPDQEEERDEDMNTVSTGLTPDEQNLIQLLEWSQGHKFTPEQVHNALRQAREIGEL
jgi:hypothetical protein